jgi:AraC family transcriptional regulator
MSLAEKTAWIIERNMDRPLTLEGLAEAVGVSRAHLARAFGAATGRSVVAYLRARRLSHSAEALAEGAPDILQVALDAGYSSHEAFTRAFREQFGATPEAVREKRSLDGLQLTRAPDLAQHPRGPTPKSRIVDEGVVRVVGLSEHFPCGPSYGITRLWQRFVPYMDAIPSKDEAMPVGVTLNVNDDAGFEYVAALEVKTFGETHPDLVRLEIPARRYAVFTHAGHVTKLQETFRAIWDECLPAMKVEPAEAPTLERHLPEFDPMTGEGGINVWIPLVK